MLTENKPYPPILQYVSYKAGDLWLLISGKCLGYQSRYLRNICIDQFLSFFANCLSNLGSQQLGIWDFSGLGMRILQMWCRRWCVGKFLVDKWYRLPMNDLKRLMLNGHSDINYFIKGLTVRDRSQPKVEDIMAVYT